MVNQYLIDYVKQQLENGKSLKIVRNTLLTQGVSELAVNEAIESALTAIRSSQKMNNIQNSGSISENSEKQDFQTPHTDNYSEETPDTDNYSKENIKMPTAANFLGKAWSLYKKKFGTFVGIMIIPALLLIGASLVIGSLSYGGSGKPPYINIIVASAINLFVYFIQIWAMISLMFAIIKNEEEIQTAEAYKMGWKKLRSFIWISILISLILSFGFTLFIIPGIIFLVWFSLAIFILIAEDIRGINALLKSKEYVRGRWGEVFGLLLFMAIVSFFIIFISALIVTSIFSPSLSFSYTGPTSSLAPSMIIIPLFYLIFVPLISTYTFFIYKSLRELKGNFVFDSKKEDRLYCSLAAIMGIFVIISMSVYNFYLYKEKERQLEKSRDDLEKLMEENMKDWKEKNNQFQNPGNDTYDYP